MAAATHVATLDDALAGLRAEIALERDARVGLESEVAAERELRRSECRQMELAHEAAMREARAKADEQRQEAVHATERACLERFDAARMHLIAFEESERREAVRAAIDAERARLQSTIEERTAAAAEAVRRATLSEVDAKVLREVATEAELAQAEAAQARAGWASAANELDGALEDMRQLKRDQEVQLAAARKASADAAAEARHAAAEAMAAAQTAVQVQAASAQEEVRAAQEEVRVARAKEREAARQAEMAECVAARSASEAERFEAREKAAVISLMRSCAEAEAAKAEMQAAKAEAQAEVQAAKAEAQRERSKAEAAHLEAEKAWAGEEDARTEAEVARIEAEAARAAVAPLQAAHDRALHELDELRARLVEVEALRMVLVAETAKARREHEAAATSHEAALAAVRQWARDEVTQRVEAAHKSAAVLREAASREAAMREAAVVLQAASAAEASREAAVLQAVSAAEARHAAALADAVQRDSGAYQQQLIELREKGEKEKEKRVQHLGEVIARRMLKKDLSRGWTAWHFMWEERVIAKRRLQAAASRIKAPELSSAFGFWSSSAAEARRLRDHEALEAARREAMVLTAQQTKAVEVARREAATEYERHLEQRLALAVQEARVQSRHEVMHEVQAELLAARESRNEALRLAEVKKDEGLAEAARGEARRQLEAAVEAARAEARQEAWAEARAEARQEVWAEMRDAALEAARAEVLIESARAEEARAAVAARALEAARARVAEGAAQERVTELERVTAEGLRASNPSASSPTRVPPASAHLYSDEEVRCAKHTALLRRAFESADADRSGGLSKREFYRSLEEVGLRFTASEQLAVWKAFVNGASGLVYARVEWRDYQRVGLALLEQQHAKKRSPVGLPRRQMGETPDQQKLLRLFTHVAQQNEVRPPVEPTVHLAWAGGAWAGRR